MTERRFEDPLIANSSIGEALDEIEELGLEHHLEHLAEELKPIYERHPACPKCGKQMPGFWS